MTNRWRLRISCLVAIVAAASLVAAQIPGNPPGNPADNARAGGFGGTMIPNNPTTTTAPAPAVGGLSENFAGNWRNPNDPSANIRASTAQPLRPAANASPLGAAGLPIHAPAALPKRPIAKITNGNGTLPNDRGQVWREYDITPFTSRPTTSSRPEQAIVEWIIRETGYETWHSEPLGVLSADHKTLKVYHTPQIQEIVSEIVDRFVNPDPETQAFGIRVLTVGNPNWRTTAMRLLHPIPAQTQGVQAWLLSKEDAALLASELRKRNDVREHSAPQTLVYNGQTGTVANLRQRNYIRSIILHPESWPGFEPEMAQLQEGFSIELHPLLSIDQQTTDAILKCNIDQIEKMIPVSLDVPTAVNPRQKQQIEVPQQSCTRLHEKFRWPTEQILLISLGVV
ncbi:MAG TPA: hypothetical protein VFE24_02985, partial [Pirellulales bacterium]|nr:hypothetical protein [Pirellulales bacterium]